MTLVFSETDLASEVTPQVRSICFDENVFVLDEEDADEYLVPEKSNTLVSYVAAPANASRVHSATRCLLILRQTLFTISVSIRSPRNSVLASLQRI